MVLMKIEFNNKSLKKRYSLAATVLGGAGALGALFLAASGSPLAIGLVPSAAMLYAGCVGYLRANASPE